MNNIMKRSCENSFFTWSVFGSSIVDKLLCSQPTYYGEIVQVLQIMQCNNNEFLFELVFVLGE